MALMLISCVAFIQDNKFFSSAPKEARDVLIQREQELFYGARAIGWTLFIISVLMILGVGVIAVWDGLRSGFTFWQFFLRFVLILTVYKICDMALIDNFLLLKFHFFQHYYPEAAHVMEGRKYGFNLKSQLLKLFIVFPAVSALAAWLDETTKNRGVSFPMKYFEFGRENEELMVLLHGGGTSYLGVFPTAKKIAEKYHVVLLAYDGFNPSEPETEFRSVAWEARGLEDYLIANYGGKVDILYGISYGCRTLMQVLEDDRLQITTTIADGMSLRDYPNIKSEALKELYLFFFTGTFFVVMGRAGKLRKRFLAKITGRSLEEADRILYTKASWRSWKNQDKCLIGKKTDYSVFARTDMHIWYGIRGTVDKKLSADLEKLKAKGYPFTCKIFEDMGHGGLVGENTERFIQEVEAVRRYARQKEEQA